MTYEAWRITFQSSEQAARSAYAQLAEAQVEVKNLQSDIDEYVKIANIQANEIAQAQAEKAELVNLIKELCEAKHTICMRQCNPKAVCPCIYCVKERARIAILSLPKE